MSRPHAQPEVVCLASFNADLTCRVPRPPLRGETLMAQGFTVGPGGKGSNAAVACARQGARVAVVARIGQDDFGRLALNLWAHEGIDTRGVTQAAGEPTGVAQIWVFDDGDNAIAVAPGAGLGLGAAQVQAAGDLIVCAKVLMAPNEVPLAAIEAGFALARQHGVLTVLNPAPARDLPASLLALCDVLTPNENELRALAALPATASLDDCAQALLTRGAGAVVVTLGARGCALHQAGLAPTHLPGHTLPVTDTVGAGDTFTGALAAALARGLGLADALPWANAAAALSVTGAGAIAGMPDLHGTAQRLRVPC